MTLHRTLSISLIHDNRRNDLALAFACAIFLVGFQYLAQYLSKSKSWYLRLTWLFCICLSHMIPLLTCSRCTARNFFVVVFATIFVYYGFWVKGEYTTFSLAGRIPSELPPFQDPYISSDRFSVCPYRSLLS